MKLQIHILTIVAVVFFSGVVFAEEDSDKYWMERGWVKVYLKPGDGGDTTRYGVYGYHKKTVVYVYPNGEKMLIRGAEGNTYIVSRKINPDGSFCLGDNWELYGKGKSCRTRWKKGNLYMSTIGHKQFLIFKIKKGNPENFK